MACCSLQRAACLITLRRERYRSAQLTTLRWAQVHRRCGCRIFVTDRKYEIMRCLEWPGVQHLQSQLSQSSKGNVAALEFQPLPRSGMNLG